MYEHSYKTIVHFVTLGGRETTVNNTNLTKQSHKPGNKFVDMSQKTQLLRRRQ
jgi:hypothetical protein